MPKTSKNPEGAVQYINWMVENNIDTMLYYGLENEHYRMEDGAIIVTDEERYKNEFGWIGTDLNLIGSVNYSVPKDKRDLVYTTESQKKMVVGLDMAERFGKTGVFLDAPRPVAQEKMAQLQQHLFEGAAKVIVVDDFEAEYQRYIDGWARLGGREYDAEIAEILKSKE